MTTGAAILIAVALALRFAGASLRFGALGKAGRVIGWLACTSAIWVAVGALGGWSPIWPSWVLGVTGALVESKVGRRLSWVLADLIMVVVAGTLSIPPMSFGLIAASSAVVAAAGYALDSAAEKTPVRFILGSVGIVASGILIVTFLRPTIAKTGAEYLNRLVVSGAWPYMGVAPIRYAERKELATGAIGWMEGRPKEGLSPGALVFHGSNPQGSQQAAAIVLRRGLLNAGFIVLALDHIGYGESPNPPPGSGVEAYDPLPSVLAAYDLLSQDPNVGDVFAVGHSMGSADTLRLLAASQSLCGGVLLGASNSAMTEDAESRYLRFHSDRKIEERIPFSLFVTIRDLFYDQERLARQVPENQTAIYFVRLENDWQNIVETRDALFEALPAPKTAWDLEGSTHYFNSAEAAGILIGDTRVARRFASWVGELPTCEAALAELSQ